MQILLELHFCYILPSSKQRSAETRLMVSQLFKNLPAFYETWGFTVTVFTRTRHWWLSWVSWVQFTPPPTTLPRFLGYARLYITSHVPSSCYLVFLDPVTPVCSAQLLNWLRWNCINCEVTGRRKPSIRLRSGHDSVNHMGKCSPVPGSVK
jgi:hypothetical protein